MIETSAPRAASAGWGAVATAAAQVSATASRRRRERAETACGSAARPVRTEGRIARIQQHRGAKSRPRAARAELRMVVGWRPWVSPSATGCACATTSATPRAWSSTRTTSPTATSSIRSCCGQPSARTRTWSRRERELVVGEAKARYLSGARFDDELDAEVTVSRLGTTAMTTAFRFSVGDRPVADCELRHVFVTTGTTDKQPIPPQIARGARGPRRGAGRGRPRRYVVAPSELQTSTFVRTRPITSSVKPLVLACPPRSEHAQARGGRLQHRFVERPARRDRRPRTPPLGDVGSSSAAQARIIAIGLATFLPYSAGAVPCGASAITVVVSYSVIEREQERLGAGDRAEHRQYQVGQAIAVAVKRRDDQRRVRRARVKAAYVASITPARRRTSGGAPRRRPSPP